MKWHEIVEGGPVGPQKPSSNTVGGVPPLTAAQGRAKAEKRRKATAKLADVRAASAIKIQAAQRNLAGM